MPNMKDIKVVNLPSKKPKSVIRAFLDDFVEEADNIASMIATVEFKDGATMTAYTDMDDKTANHLIRTMQKDMDSDAGINLEANN